MCDVIHHPTNFSSFFSSGFNGIVTTQRFLLTNERRERKKFSFVITTHTKESLLVSSCHYREVQSSVVWKFNYFCGNKEEEEEEEVKVVAPRRTFSSFSFSYIWRGRWRLTRNAAPSFFNFFLFLSDHLVTRLR